MGVAGKRFGKLLIDMDMTKSELSSSARVATSIISRMSRND